MITIDESKLAPLHTVFNIRGNRYRLVVVVKFVMGYIFIRWVGTHKEYESAEDITNFINNL